MPQQSPFPGELQVPPLLLLILPSFWVHPSPPQVNLSIYFASSPDLLNRRTPRLIFAARAAGGNGGCLRREKETRCLALFSSSLALDKSHAHQRRPLTRPLKSKHKWEFMFS